MMNKLFTIKGQLSGTNEINKANRGNRFKGAGLKHSEQEVVIWSIREQKPQTLPETLHDFEIKFYEPNNRRDADNVYSAIKVILDGMVKAHVLKEDGRRYVRHIKNEIYTDKVHPRIEIYAKEVGD